MGCINSKQAVSVTPAFDYSGGFRDQGSEILASSLRNRAGFAQSGKIKVDGNCEYEGGEESGRTNNGDSISFRLGNLQKYIEGEQVAAGWPAWLSAVAGEAIQGWVPLKADSFEKLEKIGQGTYSSVFRARDLETGKIVALKKVRFDNFEPESVRFMAREIQILRRLDHPNIVKLEGLVTSRLSCSIYLVFEYMDHDLAGLSSCPDIKFSEPQVKCYMHQLLSGLEHCHSRGIMHRDIKGANLLVNNDGILKMADFGLANFFTLTQRQPLTSRVVTLWYRPPELLLGSTDYGASVDLWSVGCVFAELLFGKPLLQGRTEVEQLHKIFKLCGSPPEEYWKKSRLPHATIFKPQQPYESYLKETLKGLPATTADLIETFLSIEPNKRGTASSALASEYFTTMPHACDPSSLPNYPPNKEIDAKSRDEARKKKVSSRSRGTEATRRAMRVKAFQEPDGSGKLATSNQINTQETHKGNSGKPALPREVSDKKFSINQPKSAVSVPEEDSQRKKHDSEGDIAFSGPLLLSASSGFAWAKKVREDTVALKSHRRLTVRSQGPSSLDLANALKSMNVSDLEVQANRDFVPETRADLKSQESFEAAKHAMVKQWTQFERPDSFDASDVYHSQELSAALYQKNRTAAKQQIMGYQDQGDRVEFSGPLLSQSFKVDELLERHDRHIRQAVRRSWFQRVKKQGK